MTTNVIGIDCAVNPADVGLAFGTFSDGHTAVEHALQCGRHDSPSDIVADWIHSHADPTLIAMDAPLGWPRALGQALATHRAGQGVDIPAHDLFRRHTDVFIKKTIGKQPLDVGADRIARTAHSALELIATVARRLDDTIALAWTPDVTGIAAIEVYPAATLAAHGIDARGYKTADGHAARQRIVETLQTHMGISTDIPGIAKRSDALDAMICLLAAQDFLAARAIAPPDGIPVEREGWIWVREITP